MYVIILLDIYNSVHIHKTSYVRISKMEETRLRSTIDSYYQSIYKSSSLYSHFKTFTQSKNIYHGWREMVGWG